jgi:putative PIN family toxin of toxin-antitoxin system
MPERIVIDTNVLVSRLLLPRSLPAKAVQKAMRAGPLLVSEATMEEIVNVLSRPRLDRYVSLTNRRQFIRLLGRKVTMVPIIQVVRECRDPKDDKFLELALNGRADLIITGDADLLVLNPWRGIEIVTPREYLTG